jgi:hypothetical protein
LDTILVDRVLFLKVAFGTPNELHGVNKPRGHGLVFKLHQQKETVMHGPIHSTGITTSSSVTLFGQGVGPLVVCAFHVGISVKGLTGAQRQTVHGHSQFISAQIATGTAACAPHGVDKVLTTTCNASCCFEGWAGNLRGLLVVNDVSRDEVFGSDGTRIQVLTAGGAVRADVRGSKVAAADAVLDEIAKVLPGV